MMMSVITLLWKWDLLHYYEGRKGLLFVIMDNINLNIQLGFNF
jgi:hypothetical protein